MKRSVEAKILNHRYVVKSDEDDEYVNQVIEYVNGKIEEIVKSTKTVATVQVAVLAALNIADDYFKLQREVSKLEDKSEALIRLIDEGTANLK
ncbi:MAG: cell division protein ZapA [Thermodesulfobacteriota bacterium]